MIANVEMRKCQLQTEKKDTVKYMPIIVHIDFPIKYTMTKNVVQNSEMF